MVNLPNKNESFVKFLTIWSNGWRISIRYPSVFQDSNGALYRKAPIIPGSRQFIYAVNNSPFSRHDETCRVHDRVPGIDLASTRKGPGQDPGITPWTSSRKNELGRRASIFAPFAWVRSLPHRPQTPPSKSSGFLWYVSCRLASSPLRQPGSAFFASAIWLNNG